MLKRYIGILIVSVLMVIFALQNVDKVSIKLWFFELDASLSLIIIISFSIGALLSLVFAFQELRSRKKTEDNTSTGSKETGNSDSMNVPGEGIAGNTVR